MLIHENGVGIQVLQSLTGNDGSYWEFFQCPYLISVLWFLDTILPFGFDNKTIFLIFSVSKFIKCCLTRVKVVKDNYLIINIPS